MEKGASVSREELYELVWNHPLSSLAGHWGISDVGLAKICDRLNVPRPSVGYWQRVRAGKQVARTPLPPAPEGVPERAEIRPAPPREPEPPPPIPRPRVTIPGRLPSKAHPLVPQTRSRLRGERADIRGLLEPRRGCLDLRVSPASLSRALRIMQGLIRYCESQGLPVRENERPPPRTLISVEGFDLEVGILEHVRQRPREEVSDGEGLDARLASRMEYRPTGRLTLRIRNGSYPGWEGWSESGTRPLEDLVPEFIQGLHAAAEAKRRAAEAREARRRQEAETQRRAAERQRLRRMEQERIDRLMAQVESRERACRIRAYLAEVKGAISGAEGMAEWIRWAEAYADSVDPLTAEKPPEENGPEGEGEGRR